ncbi:hypothetical protein [Actinophytocola sp.]|uniref:hypothetical protein n=1 Tax=Actinophytocola sp. TaxID=1872138 RepID=UPI002ED40F5F
MSEEDVRGGLRDAVADEPPLDFDADVLVATARHQVGRRRALIGVGVATVAVAVAAVALPAVFGRGQAPVADRPASTATTTSPPTRVPSTVSPETPYRYTADELRRRSQQMASHLRRAVPTVVREGWGFDFGEFGGEAAGHFYDGQNYVNAPVGFTIDGSRYSIFVTTWVSGVADPSPATVCAVACKQLGEKDGGQLVSTTDNLEAQTIRTVYHFRKNGSVVQISVYNYDMAGEPPPVYMPTIPVTLDQLTTLATDPELGL